MRDPLGVRVSGPLEPFVAGFVGDLGGRGYARVSVVAQPQLVAHLSRWMAAERVARAGLTAAVVERFVASRRAAGYRHFLTVGALAPLLDYLRSLGAAPMAPIGPRGGPADLLVERYRGYLVGERGLATSTVRYYERVARSFLGGVPSPRGELDLAGLDTAVVGRFVLGECGRCSPGSAGNVVVGLRSLLRYLHVEGLVAGDLTRPCPPLRRARGGCRGHFRARQSRGCLQAAIGAARRAGATTRC